MKIEEKSCGCIVIENGKVLLVKHNSGHWGFPKGHMEAGETEKETAIREVKEETNLDIEVDLDKRYIEEYTTDKGKYKQVVLFIAKKKGGALKEQISEIEKIKWLDYDEAIKTITFDSAREIFKKVLKDMD